MKRILKTTLFLAAIVAVTFATQSCSSVKPIDKAQLEGNWVLKSLQGEDAKAAFERKLPSVQFNFGNNTVHGNGGCNTYNGPFTLTENNEFSAPNLAATMMMCIDANKEPQFFTALSSPNLIVSLENGLLTFKQDKTIVLQFEKGEEQKTAAVTAETLAGAWNLTSISGGDFATLFTGKAPTMEISADGKVSGNAGCNNYRTAYTLEGNTITFAPVASTKMACESLAGENLFTSNLSTPLQVSLDGNKLVFAKEGNTVLEFTKAE